MRASDHPIRIAAKKYVHVPIVKNQQSAICYAQRHLQRKNAADQMQRRDGVPSGPGTGHPHGGPAAPFMVRRTSFENFKSTVCHRVMEMGDVEFMMDLLDSNAIRIYYDRHWYPESLYLLAMLDYLSRLHNLPQCSDYDDLRQCKLEKTVYPASVMAVSLAAGNDEALKQAEREAIPEFMRFNIVESEVRDVI